MAELQKKRKELMPLPTTQLKIVTLVCVPMLVCCVLLSVAQTYVFLTSMRSPSLLKDDLGQQIWVTALYTTALTLFVMVPLFIMISVWISSRLVGPMRRTAAELKAMADGRIGRNFHFRKGDDLGFVAEALSELQGSLTDRIDRCRQAFAGIEKAVQRLDAEKSSSALIGVREAASEMQASLGALQTKTLPSPKA